MSRILSLRLIHAMHALTSNQCVTTDNCHVHCVPTIHSRAQHSAVMSDITVAFRLCPQVLPGLSSFSASCRPAWHLRRPVAEQFVFWVDFNVVRFRVGSHLLLTRGLT